jgi:hypothetical protein
MSTRLSITFTTKGGRKLLGRNLDAVRRNGDHTNLERYYLDDGVIAEDGSVELICSTEEREACEAEGAHAYDSDTISAKEFAGLTMWLLANAGLEVEEITTKD